MTEFKNDFFDRIEAQARAIGEAQGRAEGGAQGRAEALIKILEARTVGLTSEQRDLVLACSDLGQLDVWVDRALAATSADEVFKD
ncbi:MAG TPA: hypothetical protein VMU95_35335 [Trebonia sp.]|nr:hypothetical protein [Trebonia sp.]